MKKVILVAIMASFAISPSFAGTPGSDNGMTARLTGNTSADYTDGLYGPVSCNETQHRKFDTVQCTFANARPDLAGQTLTNGWYSDFNNSIFGSITYTVNLDGTGFSGKAIYP